MDFRDSPPEAAFRAEARAFLEAHAPEKIPGYGHEDFDEQQVVAQARQWQRTLFEHGWASIIWPKEYGGRGLGPIEQIIWNQELARIGIGESLFLQGIGLAGPTIIAHGSEEQKTRFLEPILGAEEIWCQLFSEPGAGSDLANVAARAEKSGDAWVISGQKTWCSGASYSDWGMLLARSDPKLPKHKGITYFLIDMHSPGVEGAHFSEVFLNEIRVPDANRLGPEGAGWNVARTTLMNERMTIGGLERLFSFGSLLDHAKANRQRVDDVMRDELGRVYTWTKALELLNARVVTKLGRGVIPNAEASVMKIAIARMITKAGDIGLRLSGPEAMLRRGEWQNQFLLAPSIHIGGGTDREVPFDKLPRS
jgi:alkylation response protein AidB-like acyl-CoA dehydrogenase